MRTPELVVGCDVESIVLVPVPIVAVGAPVEFAVPVEPVAPIELEPVAVELVVPVVLVVLVVDRGVFIDVRIRSVIARVRSTIAFQLWRACSAIRDCVCRIWSTSGVV